MLIRFFERTAGFLKSILRFNWLYKIAIQYQLWVETIFITHISFSIAERER